VITAQGMSELAEGLRINTSLVELVLCDCELGEEALLLLGEVLVENKTLETLHLVGNILDVAALSLFFEFVPKMKGLMKLSMINNAFCDESAGLAIVEGLLVNSSLQTIDQIEGSELSFGVKESIHFYLQMNRNGRRFLQAPLSKSMPTGA